MWWSASAVRSDRDAPNRPCAACLHVLEGPAKRGVVGDRGVPGYAIPPSAQVARFPNSGIRHTRGMTDLLKARHGETVPLALHASRPQQLPTNASPHDPRRTYGGDHQQGELMRVATACASCLSSSPLRLC